MTKTAAKLVEKDGQTVIYVTGPAARVVASIVRDALAKVPSDGIHLVLEGEPAEIEEKK